MNLLLDPKALDQLLERLYLAKRELQSVEIEQPVFVLLTKSEAERHTLEAIILAWLSRTFGFDLETPLPYDIHPLKNTSTFRFPSGVVIMLVDLPDPKVAGWTEIKRP